MIVKHNLYWNASRFQKKVRLLRKHSCYVIIIQTILLESLTVKPGHIALILYQYFQNTLHIWNVIAMRRNDFSWKKSMLHSVAILLLLFALHDQ